MNHQKTFFDLFCMIASVDYCCVFFAKTNMSQMYLVEKSIIFQHAYLVIELVMF